MSLVRSGWEISRLSRLVDFLIAASDRSFDCLSPPKVRSAISRIQALRDQLISKCNEFYGEVALEAQEIRKFHMWGIDIQRGGDEPTSLRIIDSLGLMVHLPRSSQMATSELERVQQILPQGRRASHFLKVLDYKHNIIWEILS